MTEEITLEKYTIMRISLNKLKNSVLQFRKIYEEHVETLKETMTMKRSDGSYVGNIEPVVVRPLDKAAVPHSYEILAGYHRIEAARNAGMKHIECKVIRCQEEDAFDIALTTNLARKALTDYETAVAIKFSMDKFSRDLTEVAKRIGITKSHVSNLTRCLTQSSEFVLVKWSEGKLSTGHVKMLIQFDDTEEQTKYAEKILSGNWSVRAIEGIIKNLKAREKAIDQLEDFIQKKAVEEPELIIYTGGIFKDHYDINDLLTDSCVTDVLGTYYSWKDGLSFFEDLFKKHNVKYLTMPKEFYSAGSEETVEPQKEAKQSVLETTGEDIIVSIEPLKQPIKPTDEDIDTNQKQQALIYSLDNLIEVFSTSLVTTDEEIINLDIDREDVEIIVNTLEYYKLSYKPFKEYSLILIGDKYLFKKNNETIQTFKSMAEFVDYTKEAKISRSNVEIS